MIQKWVDQLGQLYNMRKGQKDVPDFETTVGSELTINCIRLAVYKGEIDHEDIVFIYNDEEILMDKYARMNWPLGFGDTNDKILDQMLGWDND